MSATIAALGVVAALAAPEAPALAWDAPCLSPAEAAASLDDLLLGEAPTPGEARVTVQELAPEEWAAAVEIETPHAASARVIRGERCEDVAEGALIVVAGALDPLSADEPAAPVVEPAPAPVEADPVPPPPGRPLTVELFAEGGGAAGMLPGVAGAFGGGAAVGIAWLRIELGAQHTLARRVTHPDVARVSTEIAVTSSWLAGCGVVPLGVLEAPLCLGVEGGAITARGRGLVRPGVTRGVWVGVTPQARLRWVATSWLRIGASVAVPLSLRRLSFTVEDLPGPAATSGIASARFGLHAAFILFDKKVRTRRRR
ncbi:MAG: hypothetical protein AAF721_01430 [Myxococcota bacterium]